MVCLHDVHVFSGAHLAFDLRTERYKNVLDFLRMDGWIIHYYIFLHGIHLASYGISCIFSHFLYKLNTLLIF